MAEAARSEGIDHLVPHDFKSKEASTPRPETSSVLSSDKTVADHGTFPKAEAFADVAEVCTSVLRTAPGAPKQGPANYMNLTPWVQKLFFVHTYYAYIYVFYMFVLAFYKGYALEYPEWRRWTEMVLIMVIPALQHLRFYFGHWGCELGMYHDLCAFLLLNTLVMVVLMYFLFFQAYIMPLDSTFLFIAIVVVAVEGVCGAINALQTLKIQAAGACQVVVMSGSVLLLLATITGFIVRELLPHEAVVEEYRWNPGSSWSH